jgi:hypothetical protein
MFGDAERFSSGRMVIAFAQATADVTFQDKLVI